MPDAPIHRSRAAPFGRFGCVVHAQWAISLPERERRTQLTHLVPHTTRAIGVSGLSLI